MPLIRISGECNQRCVFCSYPAEKAKGDGGSFDSLAREISKLAPGPVQISGGEPFLSGVGELLRLALFCAKISRQVEMQTNGTLITSADTTGLKALIDAVNRSGGCFNVNFPADTAALDARIAGVPGVFRARVSGVRKLLRMGAAVRLTHIVCSMNYRRLERFVSFSARNFKGLSRIQFSFVKGLGRAREWGAIPRYPSAAPFLNSALDLCDKKGIKCDVDHIPPCFLGRHYAKHVDIPKMMDGTTGPHRTEKKKVKACKGCSFGRVCAGPRKDYIKVHGEL